METDELSEYISKLIKDARGKKRQGWYYVPEGDCLVLMKEVVPYVGKFINNWCTVYEAQDDGRVIGIQLTRISEFPAGDTLKGILEDIES